MHNRKQIMLALRTAFPYTVPILAGFLFLGIAYGIFMNSLGFSAIYPLLMSLAIFAGSMEFVAANLLLGVFDPLNALLLTLMVNARHLFYGISMLDKYHYEFNRAVYHNRYGSFRNNDYKIACLCSLTNRPIYT